MHYPWWYVPFANGPMLIALIATLHVWVSLYAVGGGIFLAYETRIGYQSNNRSFLSYLHSHLKFFVLVTVVYGAITGVGIWWTISLTSPIATQSLIHIFVFGWAMEYVFFIIEIVAAFIFLYYWGRLDPRTHTIIGFLYAISAWMSLVLITGITAFQLNSGGWIPGESFWKAFFNPQTIPQIIARTGGSLMLACLYIYLHASFVLRNDAWLRDFIVQRSAKWVMWAAAFIIAGGAWWYFFLPESGMAALEAASTLNVMAALITAGTVLMFVMAYFGPYKNPGWVTQGFAIVLFAGGLANVTMGEFIREAVRKPYIVENLVLGNQIFKSQIPQLKRSGFLNGGVWTKYYVQTVAPEVIDSSGTIQNDKLLSLESKKRLLLGKTLFLHHCNNCHALEKGVSSVVSLTRGWTDELMQLSIVQLDRIHYFMPPWSGTNEEALLLAEYLNSIKVDSPFHGRVRSTVQLRRVK